MRLASDAAQETEAERLLRDVLVELRGLRHELARRRRRPRRAGLLETIAVIVQDRAFTAKEVIDYAEVDAALAAALDAADTSDARRLGQYLRYVEAHPRGDLRVIRLDEERDGIVWRIRRQ